MLSRAALKTPIGSLYLISHEHLLLAAGFSNFKELTNQLDEEDLAQGISEVKRLPIITELLEDYFAGDLKALDGISVRQPGEKFSQSAWKAMRKVSPVKQFHMVNLQSELDLQMPFGPRGVPVLEI